jgi:hypothetical protein
MIRFVSDGPQGLGRGDRNRRRIHISRCRGRQASVDRVTYRCVTGAIDCYCLRTAKDPGLRGKSWRCYGGCIGRDINLIRIRAFSDARYSTDHVVVILVIFYRAIRV